MVRIHPDPPVSIDSRGCSSVGRAPALQAGGRRFDPVQLHQSRSQIGHELTGASRAYASVSAERLLLASAREIGCSLTIRKK